MSTTPVSGNDATDDLIDAIVAVTSCVDAALVDVCSVGWTVGENYVPFNPDDEDECEDGEAFCSQAWVRVMTGQMLHVDEQSFEEGGCGGMLGLTLEVGVLRCFDIPEDGEAPTATEVLMAAMQSMIDMNAILCAVMGCESGFDKITAGTWVPNGPLGGQYGGVWTFDVEM